MPTLWERWVEAGGHHGGGWELLAELADDLREAEGEIKLLRWRAEAAEKAWAEAESALRLVVERYEEAQAALSGIFPRLSGKGEPPPEIKAAYEALAQRPA